MKKIISFKNPYLKNISFLIFFLLLWVPKSAHAQRQGLYVPGIVGGMNTAVQPPPGVYAQEIFAHYYSQGIKDQSGNTILPNLSADLSIYGQIFSWVSPYKLLGAHYAANLFLVPAANPVLDFQTFPGREASSVGFGDLYFEPLSLGWNGKRYGLTFSYGFYAPTGRFSPRADNNTGKGTWTHQLNLGATLYFDKARTWSLTNWLRGEIHQKTEDVDVTIGENITWEWALGKTFVDILNVGLVGYGEWQLTDDTGSAAILPQNHDRVFGLGGELAVAMPKIRSQLSFRVYDQFAAKSRTEGKVVFLNFSSALWNYKPKK